MVENVQLKVIRSHGIHGSNKSLTGKTDSCNNSMLDKLVVPLNNKLTDELQIL